MIEQAWNEYRGWARRPSRPMTDKESVERMTGRHPSCA
jgi:hypothetical protein